MIYIRNIFTQDLRGGKQISFTKEPSNLFFKFNASNPDPARQISFKFKERDQTSVNFSFNSTIINTRLYSEGREARIDSQFRQFLLDKLKAKINDIIIFTYISDVLFEFEFMPQGSILHSSYKAILNGTNHVVAIEQFNSEFNDNNSQNTSLIKNINLSNIKERFADWFIKLDGSKHNYFSDSFSSNRDNFIEQLTKYESIYKEQFGTSIFSISKNDLKEFIEELEKNLYSEEGEFFAFSLRTSSHMPRAILGKKNYIKFLKELLIELKTSSAKSPKVTPINKIYFGAPGTGKSFRVTEDLKEVDSIFQKRVTFHPEYDNASFVGGYKPFTDGNEHIKYDFVPQIFTNIYVEACNDPSHQYYLIIEEINRGNCAEIFGELFQLLDRDEKYKITPSNELVNYLNGNISNSKFYVDGEMLLPDNLSIYATMNTSDQSLFPMDSAFKRRWEWEYISINTDKEDPFNHSKDYVIRINNDLTIVWLDFIDKINIKIRDNRNLGMDKCIGNYFIKPDEEKVITLDKFIYKVIFYLWNDVFKDEPRDSIFKGNTSYQDFFPINDKGEKLVISIISDLKLLAPTIVEEISTEE